MVVRAGVAPGGDFSRRLRVFFRESSSEESSDFAQFSEVSASTTEYSSSESADDSEEFADIKNRIEVLRQELSRKNHQVREDIQVLTQELNGLLAFLAKILRSERSHSSSDEGRSSKSRRLLFPRHNLKDNII